MATIYLSSTYSDLIPHRKAVSDVLRQLGQQVIGMEDYVASDDRPLARCEADVRSSDYYVGILAWRYGFTPPGQDRSITELEYLAAVDRGVPVLLFLADENASWPRNQMDSPPARIEALRERLKTHHLVSFFERPEDLATRVSVAVARELIRAGEPAPSAVNIRVFNFDNHSQQAGDAKVGERLPGIVLNQLLKLQLQTRTAESRLLPSNVFMFRTGPPPDLVAELRKMAPCIAVSGYVDSGESATFHASIRVSSFSSDLRTLPLIVEDVDFEDTRTGMTAAWGDMAERIWVEAKKLNVQIERLVHQLDEAPQPAAEAREQLVALGSLDQVLEYLGRQVEASKILAVFGMLSRFDDPAAVRGLIPLLEAEDEVRFPAARLAARLGYLPALDLVARELRAKMDTPEALDLLGVVGSALARARIHEAEVCAESRLPEVRLAAVRLLETQSHGDYTHVLTARLKDDDPAVRAEAARALRTYRRRSLIPLFRQMLGDPQLGHIAACALADIGDDSGAALLIDDVRRIRSSNDRAESVGLLKRLAAESTVPSLVELLKSENPYIRGTAAEVLAGFRQQRVVDALSELVGDPEYYPRYQAAQALAEIGLPGCLPHLLRFFADEHSNCAEAAFVGYLDLGIFRAEDTGAVEAMIKGSNREEVRFYGSVVLAGLGHRDALIRIASMSSGLRVFSAGWKRYSYLGDSEILERLRALTSLDARDLDQWCAWVLAHQDALRWHPERGRFEAA